jgi:hypothetical protein
MFDNGMGWIQKRGEAIDVAVDFLEAWNWFLKGILSSFRPYVVIYTTQQLSHTIHIRL